ncbi:MAG: hypothetical protein IPJ03_14905 [Ignavibacteriales bacterium]|nr:hypothetical protein [Ignavibacteriales bacterium]
MSENNDDITVSVVEDDSEIRKILSLIIDRSSGFDANNLTTIVKVQSHLSQKNLPMLTLMDIHLPGMSESRG